MADISALGNLAPADPIDMDIYQDAAPRTLPKAGEYIVRAPESFPSSVFGKSQSGNLKVQVDPTIVGPTNEGYTIRFTSVSAKTYDTKTGVKTSQLGQYLRSCGLTGTLPGDPQAQANAVESTAGRTYRVYADWKAEHRPTGFKVQGMRNFPTDGNGGHQTWVEHPTEKGEDGKPLRLRANLEVRRFLASSN